MNTERTAWLASVAVGVAGVALSATDANAHGALEVLIGRSAGGQLVAHAELDEAVHVPRSVFPNLQGYATPSIGFENLPLDEPGAFVLADGTPIRLRLLSIDPELALYDGFNQVTVGGTMSFGGVPFDVHPLFNIVPTAQPGQEFSATVQFEDVSGVYATSAAVTLIVTPACPADTDLSGVVSVQDIFDYLTLYFGNAPRADINGSGTVTVQDVFDFLTAYFGVCP